MRGSDQEGTASSADSHGWMDVSLAAVGIGPTARLRAAADTLIDPHVLLLAVRDGTGAVVDFRYADANDAAARHFDTTVDVLVGQSLRAHNPLQAQTGFVDRYVEVLATGEDLILDGYRYPLVDGTGRSRRFDIRARKVGDAVSLTWRDVTERAEESARFAALAMHAADIVLFSRDGVVEWVSPSITGVLGWTPDECVGRSGDFLIHPDDLDEMRGARAALYAGRSSRHRLRQLCKDGGVVWCEARGNPIVASDGSVEGVVVSIRDVSEQVEAEQEREAAEARYRLVAEHASDVVCVVDADGDIAWVSPSVEGVLGWDRDELVGSPVATLLAPEDQDTADHWRRTVLGEGRSPEAVEVRFRTKAGPSLWMSLRADTAVDDAGDVTAAVCALRLCQSEVVERRAAATLSAGNALLVEATDDAGLLGAMCETAVRHGGYLFAWYGHKGAAPGCAVEPVAGSDSHRAFLDGLELTWDDGPRGQQPVGRALRSGTTQIESDLAIGGADAPWSGRGVAHGFGSCVSLPVRVNGTVEGVFTVYAAEPGAFGPRVVDLLEDLVGSLGFGIGRLRDRHELEVAFTNSIDLIASVVESRDPYTAGHQARVAELSAAIGRQLGLDDRRIEGVTYAATIHDAGKVGVPIDLLSRPGRLAEEEMALIRRHPRIGWEITSRFEWPWPVAEVILQHHERMDGTGYPQGLRGDEILLEARIVAVADVFDAVSSRRPYRAALGSDRARAIVADGAGTLFDPSVVDAFLAVLDGGFAFSGPDRQV